VRDVQISIAEPVGVEGRGELYDSIGALRDMVQSHLLQLLCIVGDGAAGQHRGHPMARTKSSRCCRALRPIAGEEVAARTVPRPVQTPAPCDGKPVAAYLDEPAFSRQPQPKPSLPSKAELGNWRWAGCPFTCAPGKRMQERLARS